jgi:hypothetical protein
MTSGEKSCNGLCSEKPSPGGRCECKFDLDMLQQQDWLLCGLSGSEAELPRESVASDSVCLGTTLHINQGHRNIVSEAKAGFPWV